MKYLLSLLLVFIALSGFAQSILTIMSFDNIPLSSQRYEVEGFMARHTPFKLSKVNSSWELPSKNYLALEYSGVNGEEVNLLFKDGILYFKRLIINYPLNAQALAKEQYHELQNYISSMKGIVAQKIRAINNKTYGSQIGEAIQYELTKSTKDYKAKEASFLAKLNFNYDNNTTTATVVGYKVKYECTDLSNTTLDLSTGFSSYEN